MHYHQHQATNNAVSNKTGDILLGKFQSKMFRPTQAMQVDVFRWTRFPVSSSDLNYLT